MSELYEGFEFYKKVQGTKYDKNDNETKEKLQNQIQETKQLINQIYQYQNDYWSKVIQRITG